MTKIKALSKTAKPARPELAVLFCLENQALGQLPYVDAALEAAASQEHFKAQKDKTLYLPSANKAKRVLHYGLGKLADLDAEALRRAGLAAARKAREPEAERGCLQLA